MSKVSESWIPTVWLLIFGMTCGGRFGPDAAMPDGSGVDGVGVERGLSVEPSLEAGWGGVGAGVGEPTDVLVPAAAGTVANGVGAERESFVDAPVEADDDGIGDGSRVGSSFEADAVAVVGCRVGGAGVGESTDIGRAGAGEGATSTA